MPSKSEKQRRFMGAELGRLRSGKKTKTGMPKKQLGDFASKTQDVHGHAEPLALSRTDASEVPVLELIGDYLYKNEGLCRRCGKPKNVGKHSEIGKAAGDWESFGVTAPGGA